MLILHTSLVAQRLKSLPAMREIQVRSLGQEDPLEKEGNGNPLQYSRLENPTDGGGCWATVHRVAKSWTRLSEFTFTFHFHALERKWQSTPVFLPGESQGRGSLVYLWGRTESDTTEAT